MKNFISNFYGQNYRRMKCKTDDKIEDDHYMDDKINRWMFLEW